MADYLQQFTAKADAVRIKLAQICLQALERPHKALEILADVNQAALTDGETARLKKIALAAKRQIQAGAIELDDAAW